MMRHKANPVTSAALNLKVTVIDLLCDTPMRPVYRPIAWEVNGRSTSVVRWLGPVPQQLVRL
jgi:hypothetical protein